MRACLRLTLLAAVGVVGSIAAGSPSKLDACFELSAGERRACVETLAEPPLADADLPAWRRLTLEDPAVAADLLQRIRARFALELEADPQVEVSLLDLQSETLIALGRFDEAAERALQALDLDSGVPVLRWWSRGGDLLWESALDAGKGRHMCAARALAHAGRVPEARSLVETSLRLGAKGDAAALWEATGGGPIAGLDLDGTALTVGRWYPPLPDVTVTMGDGGTYRLADAGGDVLVLDFWATWCEPCLKELPRLGQLYEREQRNGLQAILINVDEPLGLAVLFARDLGLTIPVGTYDAGLRKAFNARSLPTVIVADRQGRIRQRWNGYGPGIEDAIAELVRELLEDARSEPRREVARVSSGEGLLEAVWMRKAPGIVDGLALASLEPGRASIVAIAGREWLTYGARGESESSNRPPGVGLIRHADLDGDGLDELLGFRPGGTQVRTLGTDDSATTWESPHPLLDVGMLPAHGERPGRLFLGTVSGLYRVWPEPTPARIDGFERVIDLVQVGAHGAERMVVSTVERGICWLDADGRTLGDCSDAVGRAKRLVGRSPQEQIGTVSAGVESVVGNFLPGDAPEVFASTLDGQLVMLDARSGGELWRAARAEPGPLAAGDLDGDGLDELVIASGSRITVLRASPSQRDVHRKRNSQK